MLNFIIMIYSPKKPDPPPEQIPISAKLAKCTYYSNCSKGTHTNNVIGSILMYSDIVFDPTKYVNIILTI